MILASFRQDFVHKGLIALALAGKDVLAQEDASLQLGDTDFLATHPDLNLDCRVLPCFQERLPDFLLGSDVDTAGRSWNDSGSVIQQKILDLLRNVPNLLDAAVLAQQQAFTDVARLNPALSEALAWPVALARLINGASKSIQDRRIRWPLLEYAGDVDSNQRLDPVDYMLLLQHQSFTRLANISRVDLTHNIDQDLSFPYVARLPYRSIQRHWTESTTTRDYEANRTIQLALPLWRRALLAFSELTSQLRSHYGYIPQAKYFPNLPSASNAFDPIESLADFIDGLGIKVVVVHGSNATTWSSHIDVRAQSQLRKELLPIFNTFLDLANELKAVHNQDPNLDACDVLRTEDCTVPIGSPEALYQFIRTPYLWTAAATSFNYNPFQLSDVHGLLQVSEEVNRQLNDIGARAADNSAEFRFVFSPQATLIAMRSIVAAVVSLGDALSNESAQGLSHACRGRRIWLYYGVDRSRYWTTPGSHDALDGCRFFPPFADSRLTAALYPELIGRSLLASPIVKEWTNEYQTLVSHENRRSIDAVQANPLHCRLRELEGALQSLEERIESEAAPNSEPDYHGNDSWVEMSNACDRLRHLCNEEERQASIDEALAEKYHWVMKGRSSNNLFREKQILDAVGDTFAAEMCLAFLNLADDPRNLAPFDVVPDGLIDELDTEALARVLPFIRISAAQSTPVR